MVARQEVRLTSPEFLTLRLLRESLARRFSRVEGLVVDYGCGERPYEELFTRASGYRGFDFVADTKGCLPLTEDGRLPIDDRSVDAVISTQVLEHVCSPGDYFSECRRVLRPGGILILSTHGNWPFHAWKPLYNDYWRWTEDGLRLTMEQNGFHVVEVESVCQGIVSLIQQAMVMRRWGRGRLGMVRGPLAMGCFFCLNLIGLGINRVAPLMAARGNILPTCYVVVARVGT